jgi:phenylalanine-4-hydroxylase
MPLYTPEPDICHELLGRVPMFADRDFCDFSQVCLEDVELDNNTFYEGTCMRHFNAHNASSNLVMDNTYKLFQEIGLASLGASEEDILKLARCYWHSVEFGLCREDGANKAYGAGLLSSFGELEYACKPRSDDEVPSIGIDGHPTCPQIKPWDPNVAAMQDFPITTYQPVYFLAESLQDAKVKMRKYCEELPRPFFALYNAQTESVHIDRPVRRCVGVPDSSS